MTKSRGKLKRVKGVIGEGEEEGEAHRYEVGEGASQLE